MMHSCSSSNMMGQCTCGLFHTHTNSFMLFSMPANNHYESDYTCPFPPSSVDCTLSLGTPSTRLCQDHDNSPSSLCWDFLNAKNTQTQNTTARYNTSDSLLARRCANCGTTSTPLWRNGPRGPKSLCNACGIRFKKEERRATAANASVEQQYYGYGNGSSNNNKKPCFMDTTGNGGFRFIEESERDSDSFLSWRPNRPSLVHDFTRY